MIQSKTLSLLHIFVICCVSSVLSYPSQYYNKKQASGTRISSYDPYNFYYRTGYGYPMNYYPMYPSYSQNIPDDVYYSQEGYPAVFYPRTSKYEIYQAVLPYYQDMPLTRAKHYNNYYGYEQDPEEKLLQDIEREQREQAQPIGHEIRYENDYTNDDQSIDEINRAFVKNLMAMNDDNPKSFYDQVPYDYAQPIYSTNIPKWDDIPYDQPVNSPENLQVQEDEDVEELKKLTQKSNKKPGKKQRKQKQRKPKNGNAKNTDDDDIHWFKEPSYMEQAQSEQKRGIYDNTVVFSDRKLIPLTTQKPEVITTAEPKIEKQGQKEEVMMRPATPVRHPLSNSILEMMANQDAGRERERKRVPTVYDTIKKMLEMEKLEEGQPATAMKETELGPTMKKRIITNEDSLTRQLSVLKKIH